MAPKFTHPKPPVLVSRQRIFHMNVRLGMCKYCCPLGLLYTHFLGRHTTLSAKEHSVTRDKPNKYACLYIGVVCSRH